MAICPGCGGVLGRDCWNAEDCLMIAQQMEQDAYYQEQLEQAEREEPADKGRE